MLRQFVQFWSLRDPNVLWVLSGSMLLGASAGIIGCFAFLRRRSLVGDALAHAALPGVMSAFMVWQSRDPVVLLIGAATGCLAGYFSIEMLIRHTKIKQDLAFAIVLSVFFALGIFQLTLIQKFPEASQAGLDKLLFGQASALVGRDVRILAGMALAVIVTVLLFYTSLKVVAFDRQFALAHGIPLVRYELLVACMVVVSVAIGLQLVGVVLMAAMLLTPAAAARFWTEKLHVMLLLAGFFGMLAGALGANISYLAPRMPTGPWIVMALSGAFFLSMLIAPERGIIPRYLARRAVAERVLDENVLRTIYKMGEASADFNSGADAASILLYRPMEIAELEAALRRLRQKGLVRQMGPRSVLLEAGIQQAARLTRLHRLWELYLSKNLDLAADHVHANAEEMEHILNDDLEQQLLAELHSPQLDPHGRSIPKEEKA